MKRLVRNCVSWNWADAIGMASELSKANGTLLKRKTTLTLTVALTHKVH